MISVYRLTLIAALFAAAYAGDEGGVFGVGVFGVIHDASGHLLSDAEVQIQSESSGVRWRIKSDDTGRYSMAGLPSGRYKLTVRLPGFRTVSRVGVAFERDQERRVDFALELLTLHEVVTVT